jgi:hypothetical protein
VDDDRTNIQEAVDRVLRDLGSTNGWHIRLGASVTRVGG